SRCRRRPATCSRTSRSPERPPRAPGRRRPTRSDAGTARARAVQSLRRMPTPPRRGVFFPGHARPTESLERPMSPPEKPVRRRSRKSPPKVGFVSLGCPKAMVDSERILTQLRAEGYDIVGDYDGSDLVVVNTCGF